MARTKKPQIQTTGVSGTLMNRGKVFSPLRRQTCSQELWPILAEEMYTFDSDISTVVEALIGTLAFAEFVWKPGDENDPVSVALAEELNQNMGLNGSSGRMKRGFEEILKQILLYLPVGFRYMELQWIKNKDKDIWDLYDIKDRKPSAHDQWVFWEVDDNGQAIPGGEYTNELQGVIQVRSVSDTADRGPRYINAHNLLLFVHQQEGDDYNGKGMLRSLEAAYHRKNEAELKEQHFLRSKPVPIITIDDRAMSTSLGDNCELASKQKQIETAQNSCIDLFYGRSAFLLSFSDVKVETQMILNHEPEKAAQIKTAASQEIMNRFFLQFLRLGITDTGARSVGVVHESFFRQATVNVLDYVCSVFNGEWAPGRGLSGQYAHWNAPGETLDSSKLPVLTHKGLVSDRLLENMSLVLQAYSTGLVTKQDEDESAIRSSLGLPARVIVEAEDVLEDQSEDQRDASQDVE